MQHTFFESELGIFIEGIWKFDIYIIHCFNYPFDSKISIRHVLSIGCKVFLWLFVLLFQSVFKCFIILSYWLWGLITNNQVISAGFQPRFGNVWGTVVTMLALCIIECGFKSHSGWFHTMSCFKACYGHIIVGPKGAA